MAYQIGQADNLNDLFDKIVSFLTTDTSLVAANQQWEVMRIRRDNLLSVTTDATLTLSAVSYRTYPQIMRYDSRTLNTDTVLGTNAHALNSVASVGKSVIMRLREAREVKTVLIRASTQPMYAPTGFRLQSSDDGATWTTVLTVAGAPGYNVGERRLFDIPGTPGVHEYWRIVLDSLQAGAQWAMNELLLLEADGTVANHFGNEVIFKAPGLAGSDDIYSGIRTEYDAGAGWYNLFMNGFTGYADTQPSWFLQPGAIPGGGESIELVTPLVPCWDTTMPYWFVASGRAFRFALKVSTSYEGGYLGFFLPYASPSQYPYPMAVGGSLTVSSSAARATAWRYSEVSYFHGVYPGPGSNGSTPVEEKSTTLYLRAADGSWKNVSNRPLNSADSESVDYIDTTRGVRGVWPHIMFNTTQEGSRSTLKFRECLGGGYIFQECILFQLLPAAQVLGQLEGTFVVSGFQNAAENTATVGEKDFVVFQNAYRNTVHEFWALSLDETA